MLDIFMRFILKSKQSSLNLTLLIVSQEIRLLGDNPFDLNGARFLRSDERQKLL